MPERTDWEESAKGIIRGEMARAGVTYAQLAEKLQAIGIDENERNLRNKVSRGNSPQGSCCNASPHWECSNCAWTDHRCIGRASSTRDESRPRKPTSTRPREEESRPAGQQNAAPEQESPRIFCPLSKASNPRSAIL